MSGPPTQTARLRVLDLDTDLAAAVEPDQLAQARRCLVAPTATLAPGPWRPRAGASDGCLGVLLLDGVLCREVSLRGPGCAELIGPGDLVRPWEHPPDDTLVQHQVTWQVLAEARVALISRGFVHVAARWPALCSALLARGLQRSQALALSAAISTTMGIEQRLLMLFWHLADRWGRVRGDGIVVPVPLTHELIARLVGARRPSVSTALKSLERQGRLARMHCRGWLLTGAPSDIVGDDSASCAAEEQALAS